MAAVVIVGAQWGDEGKGKIVDRVAHEADMVVRYAGGPNAGHTLVVGSDKLIVRLLPSGILRESVRCVLGQGMVIDPEVLTGELETMRQRGVSIEGRVFLSERAHLILPHHVVIDTLREGAATAEKKIGTTKRGIGPCYEDKAARRGIRVGDLRDIDAIRRGVDASHAAWEPVATALGGRLPSTDEVIAKLEALVSGLIALAADTSTMVNQAIGRDEKVLLEGAQGTLLDLDHGTYPFVTSSSAVAGGACTGAGIGPTRIRRVIGIAKAYLTRVGGGPFPTELEGEQAEALRTAGAEFGSVTGRPRRVGWLDVPALRYATYVNGLDQVSVTKLDVLTGLSELKVCVGYNTPGGRRDLLPVDALSSATPIYETLPGWTEDITGVTDLGKLPAAARDYLDFVAKSLQIPLMSVSVGAARDQTLDLLPPFAS